MDSGAVPVMEAERAKYERLWGEVPDYRINSPGEQMLMPWLKIVKPLPQASVIDFGCGGGKAAMVMGLMSFRVRLVDIAANCLAPEVAELVAAGRLSFRAADITDPGLDLEPADLGYCCDVMEHIPTDRVEQTIRNIVRIAADSFFLVNFCDDHFGADIGETLHLTVRPYSWWLDLFRSLATITDARDLCGKGIFRVAR